MNKKLIIIYGPTGVGKTDYALNLGSDQKIEIINGDVGQFYAPFGIGTAKPDWQNEPIPHHLFDILTEPKDCTVVEYRTLVLNKVHEVWQRGNLPVIVGGSGFYIKSLFFKPTGPHCPEDEGVDQEDTTSNSTQELWETLQQRDPERAQSLYQQDRYRIERALALLNKGVKPSDCAPVYEPLEADILLLFLNRERSELYERINQRTCIMLDQGWVQEVEKLLGTDWEQFLMRKKLIGYNTLITYLHGERSDQDREHLIATIQKKTRNYAKRQVTFWRMLKELMNQQLTAPSQALEINLSLQDATPLFYETIKKFLGQ